MKKLLLSTLLGLGILLITPSIVDAQLIRGSIRVQGTVESEFFFASSTNSVASSTISHNLEVVNLSATSTQSERLRVTNLINCDSIDTDAQGDFKCGVDAGAGAVTLQAAYDNSAVDAQTTLADSKDVIWFLQDTATDPNLQVFSSPDGQGRFEIGTADGSATTTLGVWENFGRIGIGTTTPGSGLSVQATSTLLGLDAYIFGQLNIPYLVSTSTTNSGFGTTAPGSLLSVQGLFNSGSAIVEGSLRAGELTATNTFTYSGSATSTWANAGLSVAGGGLASSQGLTLTGGDILSSGKLTITSVATSSNSGTLDLNGLLDASSLLVSDAGTTTFVGGIDATNLRLSDGLHVDTGDALFDQKIQVLGTATSSIPTLLSTNVAATSLTLTGILESETTGTSTFAGGITAVGLASSQGLNISTGDSLLSGKLVVSNAATSSFSGGLDVTGDMLGSDLNLSGQLSVSGRLEILGTATSSYAGGITATDLLLTQGLRLDGGKLIVDEHILVSGTGTSTFSGTIAIDSSTGTSTFANALEIGGTLEVARTAVGGTASSSLNVNCQDGNYQEVQIDRDSTLTMTDCFGGQNLRLGIMVHTGGDFQMDWDGITASSSLYWREATSTVGFLEQGKLNLCGFSFATSSSGTFAFADCAGGFSPK